MERVNRRVLRLAAAGLVASMVVTGCSGQVLVFHDLLGMFDRFTPKFVKRYADLHTAMLDALNAFKADIEAGRFPAEEHTYSIDDAEWQRLESPA